MDNLINVDLNGRGIDFMMSRLSSGGSFSRKLLERVSQLKNAYAPLPREKSSTESLDFNYGGITSQQATIRWLVSYISSLTSKGTSLYLLVEDLWARSSDIVDTKDANQVFCVDGTVCRIISLAEIDNHTLSEFIRSTISFEYNGFIARMNHEYIHTTRESIDDYVNKIELLLVTAFDREGLMISDVNF